MFPLCGEQYPRSESHDTRDNASLPPPAAASRPASYRTVRGRDVPARSPGALRAPAQKGIPISWVICQTPCWDL